jgi:arylformamidase
MTAVPDYEAEYNNRARVPEHPAIIEGWARDAAAYREANPPATMSYGPGERNRIDVFQPTAGEPAPRTVLFIHGGYWQVLDRALFSHCARGLCARGVAVAVPSYSLCPQVRVGDIVEEMRAAARMLAAGGAAVVAAGHSAGGHLAACLLGTDWPSIDADLPARLVPAAFAISGLFDLRPLVPTSINRALGLDPAEAEAVSPLFWPAPSGSSLDAVVGGDESGEYHRQSRRVADKWGAAGVRTRFEAFGGANHFTVVAPLADPGSAMVERLAALAGER